MMNFFKKNPMLFLGLLLSVMFVSTNTLIAQKNTSNHGNRFEQLGTVLPSPNQYRGMDGAPGPEYWQQRADYDINCRLDTEKLRLDGSETITYYNQSPNTLRYLWMQLAPGKETVIGCNGLLLKNKFIFLTMSL